MRQYIYSSLCLFALGYLSSADAVPTPIIRDMNLEDVYRNKLGGTQVQDSWAYYRLDLKNQSIATVNNEWDLVLEVEDSGFEWSDPNLYVTFVSLALIIIKHLG